jgi:hypothetical protein
MFIATSEILKEKSFNNEAIIPNEIKPIEEMIKGRGQKKILARGQ